MGERYISWPFNIFHVWRPGFQWNQLHTILYECTNPWTTETILKRTLVINLYNISLIVPLGRGRHCISHYAFPSVDQAKTTTVTDTRGKLIKGMTMRAQEIRIIVMWLRLNTKTIKYFPSKYWSCGTNNTRSDGGVGEQNLHQICQENNWEGVLVALSRTRVWSYIMNSK